MVEVLIDIYQTKFQGIKWIMNETKDRRNLRVSKSIQKRFVVREKCESPKKSQVKAKAYMSMNMMRKDKEKILSVSGRNSQSLFFRIILVYDVQVYCIREECLCILFFSYPYARIFVGFSMWAEWFQSISQIVYFIWVSILANCILSGNYTYFYFVHFNRMRYLNIRIFVLGFLE